MNSTTKQSGMTCASCGSNHLTSRPETEEFPYGTGNEAVFLHANVEVFHCEDCQFEFTGPDAEDARHQAVCSHLGVMTPTEVKEVRERYGLSRAAFATLTRLGEASIGRWEAGSHVQNRAYDNYLYLLRYEDNRLRLQNRGRETTGAIAAATLATRSIFQCIETTNQARREQAGFELRPDLISEAA